VLRCAASTRYYRVDLLKLDSYAYHSEFFKVDQADCICKPAKMQIALSHILLPAGVCRST
jgi:hypothetical protein